MRVLVADDHSLFRDGIISLLDAGGYEVVGQAGDGETATEKALSLRPDLVLLDINMPRKNGIEALKSIKSALPGIKVVMLTVSEDDENLLAAIRAGADGYLLKHLNANEFLQLISGLEGGEAAIPRVVASRLFRHIGQGTDVKTVPLISGRELEVLRLVAAGKSNREIADLLSLSENTVKFHLKNITLKLNVSNRTEAVMVAYQKLIL
ncbi:MAG TPA: response regulator transcription factor [Anaerolineales bacterium]